MLNKIHNPDILSCLANLSNDEVFTPPNIAKQMLDTLPQELFKRKDTKFLDPFTKSGVFLREIAIRLIKGLEQEIPDLQERVNHIMQHQIYGIGITELTALLARRTLYCAKSTTSKHSVTPVFKTQNGNIAFEPTQHTWNNNGKCKYCGTNKKTLGEDKRENLETHAYQFIHNKNPFKNMKFDVIIGNPPYQLSTNDKGAQAKPIYHLFVEQAIKMQPHYLIMITPSRWFSGGMGLDDFRKSMLKDTRIKEIHDYPNSSEVFPGVEIKGGVNYFLWQIDYKGYCLIKTYKKGKCISEMKRPLLEENGSTFIRQNKAISILRKVKLLKEKSFSEKISVISPFGLPTTFRNYKNTYFPNSLKLYGTKFIGYTKRENINSGSEYLGKYKVYISSAYGAGESFPHQILNKPFIGEPNSCSTQTYLVINPHSDIIICENVISYLKTKFLRFLVLLNKPTQHASKKVYLFVPTQNFDEEWTDEKLYTKYGLTENEIAYIESMIRPMD